MNNSNNLPKELPSMEYEFDIDVEGNTTRQKWLGSFKFLIPNNKIKAQIDLKRAEYNGGLEDRLDAEVLILNYTIAYLRYSLVEAPKWWIKADYGYSLYDFNVVNEVYKKCQNYEEKWLKTVWGEESSEPKENKKSQ